MELPKLPPKVPRKGRRALRWFGERVLSLLGWRVVGQFPDRSKFEIIAAPHTSNWDFVIGLSAALALDIDAHWIGKHTIFRWPFGGMMRRLGGIPVDRTRTEGLVEQVVQIVRSEQRFILGIAPEGTRKAVDRWRSGFYYIAVGADIPILCAFFDYKNKTVGVGPTIEPTGDYERDLAEIMEFYRPFKGKRSKAIGQPRPESSP